MLNLPKNSRLNCRMTNSICMRSLDHFVSSIKLRKKREKSQLGLSSTQKYFKIAFM